MPLRVSLPLEHGAWWFSEFDRLHRMAIDTDIGSACRDALVPPFPPPVAVVAEGSPCTKCAPSTLTKSRTGFWDVGAFGRVSDREAVWAILEPRNAANEPDEWETSDFRIRLLGAGTYVMAYLGGVPKLMSPGGIAGSSAELGLT